MKRIHILILLLVYFFYADPVLGQVTKAKAIYKVKLEVENSEKDKFSKRIKMVLEEIENIRVAFLYSNGKGSFKATEDIALDYMTQLNRNSARTFSGTRDNYYYNLEEKKIASNREIEGTVYTIVYRLDTFDWQLHNETKTVHDYVCYKATAVYSYKARKGPVTLDITAWYAPQIPLPLGPKNYTGLPGLILELQEGPRTMYITELSLNPKQKITIEKVPQGEEVTEKEFEKIAAEAYGDLLEAIKNE